MATNVSVTWLQKKQFVGIDSSKHSMVISAQDEENATGMTPSELLLLGLAGCSAYDVVGILGKKKKTTDRHEVKVSAEQDADPPWPYRQIHLEYILRGKGLTDKNVGNAIHLSETKYCSVAATIRPTAEITTSYQIIAEDYKTRAGAKLPTSRKSWQLCRTVVGRTATLLYNGGIDLYSVELSMVR